MNWNRQIVTAGVLLLLSLMAAVYFYQAEKAHQREVSQPRIDQALLEEDLEKLPEDRGGEISVELFFFRPDLNNPGLPALVSGSEEISRDYGPSRRARDIVNRVLQGSRGLVSAEARALQVYLLDNGTAVVDLSRETAESLVGSIEAEFGVLLSITRSLTHNLAEVEQVRFLVDGQDLPTFAGHVSIRSPFR
jgi:hypothetical protein